MILKKYLHVRGIMKKATVKPEFKIRYTKEGHCNKPYPNNAKCPQMKGYGVCLYGSLVAMNYIENQVLSDTIFFRHTQCISDEVNK